MHRPHEQYGLEDMVVFAAQGSEILPYYYSAAGSRDAIAIQSFSMVALEAMAWVQLSPAAWGLTYTIRDGETGYLVPEHLRRWLKINLVLGDDCLLHRLGHRATRLHASLAGCRSHQLTELYGSWG